MKDISPERVIELRERWGQRIRDILEDQLFYMLREWCYEQEELGLDEITDSERAMLLEMEVRVL